jgi:DNA helicase-2/ATP-dependent DNA helicase PcrA
MIKSFQVINQNQDAWFLTDHVTKKTGLVQELKKDGTPEGIARIENIEVLMGGIKDFIEGQKEIDGARGALSEFMEDVALATDLDKDTGDDDRVALMTIHLAKGLEFPYVFIVGLEEDLFPSAMSLNTRSELEEERRLFYVALTRAEHQAYLTYAQSRYRWGKLTDSEPSRFIEEITGEYLEYINPSDAGGYRYKPMIDIDIFGDVDKSKLRLAKPVTGTPPKRYGDEPVSSSTIRKLKPVASNGANTGGANLFDNKLAAGNIVMHERFGKGEVINLEGAGADKKAEIRFEVGGIKKLLLRFAKLDIIG